MSEIFVSTTGNDMTGDGFEERPFATVTRGARDLGPGDRLSLKTGTYYENVVLETPDMGCYVAYDSPPLQVGVEGRQRFPSTGLAEPVPPVLG